MLAQNPHPNLLSLKIVPSQTDRFTLMLECGPESFTVGSSRVQVGLMGWQFHLEAGATPPVTLAHLPLLEAIDQVLAQRWSNFHTLLSPQQWQGFWVWTEGLQGTLTLGEIPAHGLDFCLSARVTAADLRVLAVEGLWHHDIAPNVHGVLERRVVQALLPTLSHPLSALGGPRWVESAHPVADLTDTIEALTQTPLDFLSLLRQAGLNPAKDLVGINLMGGDLRNVDLSNADLSRANLRGADLSDGDFTEVNFSYARLSGADLSGALLSNANFQWANLHRASLALTNLNGADLRGADLRGANLSQVSLQGAKVAGLQWGDNEGISPELERYLEAGGAIR